MASNIWSKSIRRKHKELLVHCKFINDSEFSNFKTFGLWYMFMKTSIFPVDMWGPEYEAGKVKNGFLQSGYVLVKSRMQRLL